jgi:hypothetical protein
MDKPAVPRASTGDNPTTWHRIRLTGDPASALQQDRMLPAMGDMTFAHATNVLQRRA